MDQTQQVIYLAVSQGYTALPGIGLPMKNCGKVRNEIMRLAEYVYVTLTQF